MKSAIVWLAFGLPVFGFTQSSGIQWTESLTWGQALARAKSENKYIFLDCYATWCQPCHAMDKDVYPNEEVGKIINEKFIAIKVQMDKTTYDGEAVKKWYNDAKRIESNFAVTSFPTFLFFYPDGTPMHRAVGYRSPGEFINLAKDALNPNKQYYALLQNYQPGKFDSSELKGLARALRNSGGELGVKMAIEYLSLIPRYELETEDNINLMCDFGKSSIMQEFVSKYLSSIPSNKFSNATNIKLIRSFSFINSIRDLIFDYVTSLNTMALSKNLPLLSVFKNENKAIQIADRYIKTLKSDKIFNKDVLLFLADFTKSSKDKGFNIFYKYSSRVDKILQNKGYALAKVMHIIMEEEYSKYYMEAVKIGADNMPWKSISETVKRKYGASMMERVDIYVKSSLYEHFANKQNKYWPEYINNYIQKVERYGTDTTGSQHKFFDVMLLNNFVFDAIFYHSTDTNQIRTGLKWMEGVIRRNPKEANNIDTYANLLYKAGKIKEAILWQEKAVQIAIEEKQEWVLPSLKGNLSKMKKGEPTWIKEGFN